jgi:hypothetical protein
MPPPSIFDPYVSLSLCLLSARIMYHDDLSLRKLRQTRVDGLTPPKICMVPTPRLFQAVTSAIVSVSDR